MDTLRYYPGGLETDGSVGDFTLLWYDGIVQVLFHVTTMMMLKDDDTNNKKKHIGNDSCIIVYNESDEEYRFNMIKVNIVF
jgi:tuberous sclerosis protein 2